MTLDIDNTLDAVQAAQRLSLFHAHHDESCFVPIHIYDIAAGRPVALILRTGKMPSGRESADIGAGSTGAAAAGRQRT